MKKKTTKKVPKAKQKDVKGGETKGTGGAARKEIRRLAKYMTNDEIGKKVGRAGATISSIKSGDIKNVPQGLLNKLKKAKPTASQKKKTMKK